MIFFPFLIPFKPGLLRFIIGSVLEGGHNFSKIGLAIGVVIGGAAAKIGRKNHLLVIMYVRLSRKIVFHKLTNWT